MDVPRIAEGMLRVAGIAHETSSAIVLDRTHGSTLAILLVFADRAPAPALVVKVALGGARASELIREHQTLELLRRHLGRGFAESVPAPVHLGEIDGALALAETALPGTRMKNFPADAYFASPRFRADLSRVLDWLRAFQERLSASWTRTPTSAEATLREYRSAFVRSPALDRLLDEAQERLRRHVRPAVPWHGDFCTANLLVDPGGIGVVDWEEAREVASPLADALHFAASVWAAPYAKGRDALKRNQREVFFGEGPRAALVGSALRSFTRACGLEAHDLLGLAVWGWASHANRKLARLRELGDETPAAEARNWPLVVLEGGGCLNLEWLAESRERFVLLR